MILPEGIFIHCGKLEATIKYLVAVLIVILFGFRMWQSTGCQQFNGFYFNPISIKIDVEGQSSLDPLNQKLISKIFHNKIVAAPFEVAKSFTRMLDTRFLLDVLGPAGLLLFVIGIFQILTKRKKLGYAHLAVVSMILLMSLSSIPPKISLRLIAIAFYSLSFWGVSVVSKNKYICLLSVILIFISFWYFAINWQMPQICNEIFFN